MHVLVTADSLSGSWTYARELVTGLVTRGVHVTLVSFGEIPLPQHTSWMDHLHGLDYRPTAFRLEWMQEAEEDLPESSAFLASLVREVRPDVLHLNQFCYGNLPVDVPRVVMTHGDLMTWAHAVHDQTPRPERLSDWYRNTVRDLGKGYVRHVADAHQRRAISSFTAASYLNVKVEQIPRLAITAGVRETV